MPPKLYDDDEQQYTIESPLLLDCIEFIEVNGPLDRPSQRVLSDLRAIARMQDKVHSPRWVADQFSKLLEQAHDRWLLASATTRRTATAYCPASPDPFQKQGN